MATKIRLQRHGKKGKPFYYIIVADARAPRDGRFIERLGSYNPNTDPATIDINFEKTLDWVNNGAQPTDTCRAILSYKGVLYKKHLQGGLKKGALTEEQVESKFQEWLDHKDGKITGKTHRRLKKLKPLLKKKQPLPNRKLKALNKQESGFKSQEPRIFSVRILNSILMAKILTGFSPLSFLTIAMSLKPSVFETRNSS